jgi:putative ATPase
LNQVETLFDVELDEPLDPAGLSALLHRRVAVYDKDREGHYNLISALHKSLRGSDPQSRFITSRGCWSPARAALRAAPPDPVRVGGRRPRRPAGAVQCLAAKDAYDFLGSPEGELAIVQACLYLATAPKSNAAYVAQKTAWRSANDTGSLMPPAHILNAPTA